MILIFVIRGPVFEKDRLKLWFVLNLQLLALGACRAVKSAGGIKRGKN